MSSTADVASRVRHPHTIVTADNLEAVRPDVPDLVAAQLAPGCVVWRVGAERIVVWPDDDRACLAYPDCTMLGSLVIEGDRLLLVESRSRVRSDLNTPPAL